MNRVPGPATDAPPRVCADVQFPYLNLLVRAHRRVAERLLVPEPSSSPAIGAPRTQAQFERAAFVRAADTMWLAQR